MSEDLGVGGFCSLCTESAEGCCRCGGAFECCSLWAVGVAFRVFVCKVNVRKWYGAAKKVCSRPRPRYFKCVRFAPY